MIPDKINYHKIKSISSEGREKLNTIKPKTIGQASRISGVSPSDISVLTCIHGSIMFHVEHVPDKPVKN